MKKIGAWARDYFAFSRTETRGAVVLLLLTACVLGTSGWLTARRTQPTPISEQDWQTLDSLVAVLDQATVARASSPSTPAELFFFNPNEADSATLTKLGLTPWIAGRVVRYRSKGGKFRRRSDFKKIYGLSEETYRRLYDYIELPEATAFRKKPVSAKNYRSTKAGAPPAATYRATKKERVLSVDINTADTVLLKQLPGIGSKLSARIVKYRQMLGGYHHLDQLGEIYHITDQGLASLQKSAYIAEENHLARLSINRSDAKTLARHPYISWEVANALVAHRRDYGEYRSPDDLREVYLINPKLFEKIAPYLEL